jgi:UDP-N-acetylglucosamine 2-epimerase (non-hydrolysing)
MPIFGTRPEAIKMASIVKELQAHEQEVKTTVTVTAQHRHLLDQALSFFQIKPDYDLDIMRYDQTSSDVVSRIMLHLQPILIKEKPDVILVQGDTSTCIGAGLCAFYNRIPIGHVEAGLRSWNRLSPFPEEQNRRLVDSMSDLLFAPTERAKENLLKEGHDLSDVHVVGNSSIDVLSDLISQPREIDEQTMQAICNPDSELIVLVTAHRAENIGEPLLNLCKVIKSLVKEHPNRLQVVFPVHPNPRVSEIVTAELKGTQNVTLLEPLPYNIFISILKRSYLVITDSGGVQEEAAYLGKPNLILREYTERIESVESGTSILVGTSAEKLKKNVDLLMKDSTFYSSASKPINPYGSGRASTKIVDCLLNSPLRKLD